MSENQTHSYINVPARSQNKGACSGCRVKVTLLRVAVVLAVVLIIAYVFDGVALFFHPNESANKLQTMTNQSTSTPRPTIPHTCTCPPRPPLPTCPPRRRPTCPKPCLPPPPLPPPSCPPPACPPPRLKPCPPPRTCPPPPPLPSDPPPFICPPPPPPLPCLPPDVPDLPCPVTLSCDIGWELRGRQCYLFSSIKLTWSESRNMCQLYDGFLVKIESPSEQKFLHSKVSSLMLDNEDKFWIGLTDSETEGVWKWTDGFSLNPLLTFWMANPDLHTWTGYNYNYPEAQDCVVMGEKYQYYNDNSWLAVNCYYQKKFICKKTPTQNTACQ